jgi:hypothetical protein
MPTIQPTHSSALRALLQGDQPTPEILLKKARFVLQSLDDYRPPPFPDRPAVIALDDHELLDAYHQAEHGVKVGADKQRALSYFGKWRLAVWSAEAVAGGRLAILVESARTFEAQEHHEEADAVWAFAESSYPTFDSQRCPSGMGWIELRDWALIAVRDLQLLPRYMRIMRRPKGGVPFHKPQGERAEPEDDRLEQEKMPWE